MLADVASEFFRLHDIAVNARKTEFAYNNVSPSLNPRCSAIPASRLARPVAVIARKQLTAQEACYVVEAVVQARIAYGLKVTPLTERQCDRLDAIWMRVVKHHGGLAASTSNYALWSHGTYSLPRTAHMMAKNQITDLLVRLCGEPEELLSQVMMHRIRTSSAS
eukprot:tig00020531_g9997.t1